MGLFKAQNLMQKKESILCKCKKLVKYIYKAEVSLPVYWFFIFVADLPRLPPPAQATSVCSSPVSFSVLTFLLLYFHYRRLWLIKYHRRFLFHGCFTVPEYNRPVALWFKGIKNLDSEILFFLVEFRICFLKFSP